MSEREHYIPFQSLRIPKIKGLSIWTDYKQENGYPSVLMMESDDGRFSMDMDYEQQLDWPEEQLIRYPGEYEKIVHREEHKSFTIVFPKDGTKKPVWQGIFRLEFQKKNGRVDAIAGQLAVKGVKSWNEVKEIPELRRLWKEVYEEGK